MTALLLTFLTAAFGTTPGATGSLQAALAWADYMTAPLQKAAGRWVVFRLTDAQFGTFIAALAACFVAPSLIYALRIAPLGAFIPARSFSVWMTEAALITYAAVEVCHLKAHVREKRWERTVRLIDG